MVINVTRGRGFRGLLGYVLGEAKKPEIVGGNVAGVTPAELNSEFAAARTANARVRTPVFHCSLSIPPGERLPREKWAAISQAMLSKLGLNDGRPYLVVRHGDKEHDHAHIVTSRVNYSGEVWEGGWQVRRALKAKTEVEKEFGLAVTPVGVADEAKVSRGEMLRIGRAFDQGKDLDLCADAVLRKRIDAAISGANGDSNRFAGELTALGVEMKLNRSHTTGRVSGVAFRIGEDQWSKGSKLGKAYGWQSISARIDESSKLNPTDHETIRTETEHADPGAFGAETGGAAGAARDVERTSSRDAAFGAIPDRVRVPDGIIRFPCFTRADVRTAGGSTRSAGDAPGRTAGFGAVFTPIQSATWAFLSVIKRAQPVMRSVARFLENAVRGSGQEFFGYSNSKDTPHPHVFDII
jgi:hypothetical protein